MNGRLLAICTSDIKGVRKQPVEEGLLKKGWGLKGDAHGGENHRQISILSKESVERLSRNGIILSAGDFGENLLVSGINLSELQVGALIKVGAYALLRVTQIGKECRHPCSIKKRLGKCIMPSEGIFCEVLKGGKIRPGDRVSHILKIDGNFLF